MGTDEQQQGRQRVTISDVARALGVSVSTISNAYNRPDQLSAQLRERVLAVASELGYAGPDPLARGLRRRAAGAVGVLFAERLAYAFSDPAAVQVLDGIASALESSGLGLLLVPGRADDPTTVQQAMVDGFVVYSMLESDPLLAAALRRRLPTVLIDQPPRPGISSITIDDVDGARQAASHLLDLGHRRVAIITDRLDEERTSAPRPRPHERVATSFFATRRRFQGYQAAFAAAGLDWDAIVIVERPENSEAEGAAALHELLARPVRPTAVLCVTDRLALGALEAARQAGLAVPADLSLIGFDDVPKAAQARPGLTTIHQAHREKGRLAGEALLGRLRGTAVAERRELPVQLIVRGSTGQLNGV